MRIKTVLILVAALCLSTAFTPCPMRAAAEELTGQEVLLDEDQSGQEVLPDEGQTTAEETEDGQEEPAVPDPVTVTKSRKTTITGVDQVHNRMVSGTVKDTIRVSKPMGRWIRLQRYDKKTKTWKNTSVRQKLNKGTASQRVTITFPDRWKKTTYSRWRFYVPEKTVTATQTDQDTGQITTTKTTYRSVRSPLIKVIAANRTTLPLTCKRACILDQNGYVLYNFNANQKCSQASITKLMTIFMAFESGLSEKTKIKITKNAYEAGIWGGMSATGGRIGDKFTLGDLLKAAAVPSSNDAAEAIGDYIGGDEKTFAKWMTNRARKLGMMNTQYRNASGLTMDGHYTTAKDQAILLMQMREIYGERFQKLSCRYSVRMHNLTNSARNRTLTTTWYRSSDMPIKSILGAKTGSTYAAGQCMATIYKPGKKTYYVVNLGSEYKNERFTNARMLFRYARKYGK